VKNFLENSENIFNINFDFKLGKLVHNFKNNDDPFQRWIYYQESFSTELLDWFLKYQKIDKKNSLFLDPFCGSGSSLVGAQKNGIDSIGIDLNPLSCLISEVKTNNYKSSEIKYCKNFEIPKFKEISNIYSYYNLSIVKNIFSKKNLIKINLIKNSIKKINNENVRKILLLNLICILEKCSNYKKGGNGIKRRKNIKNLDIFVEFKKSLKIILFDIESKKTKSKCVIYNENIKNFKSINLKKKISFSLFSPPYVNCFDYFEVYKIELWFGNFINDYNQLRLLRKKAITSNLNADIKQKIDQIIKSKLFIHTMRCLNKKKHWNKNIPNMVNLYFIDMLNFLESLKNKVKKNSIIAIVVGNSSYQGVPVATDLILSEIAQSLGYKVKEIIVTRNNETSSQQYKKIGKLIKYIRESIIILEL
jgi:hypothetical protein